MCNIYLQQVNVGQKLMRSQYLLKKSRATEMYIFVY